MARHCGIAPPRSNVEVSIKAGCGTWAISRQLVAGLGGLGVRQPLDADQLKRLPLGLPQAVHRPQNAAGVLAKESLLPGGAATPDSARAAAWGCSSKRPARSLSCQRMRLLARAKDWGTVWGRTSRRALSSPATVPPSSSSFSGFNGGCVVRW